MEMNCFKKYKQEVSIFLWGGDKLLEKGGFTHLMGGRVKMI